MKVRAKKLAALMLAGALVLSGFTQPEIVNAEETGEKVSASEEMTEDTQEKQEKPEADSAEKETEKKESEKVTEESAKQQKKQAVGASKMAAKAVTVAKIGDQEYESLKAAIDAVGDGETIVLTQNVPNANGISVPSGKKFTIDFAGHIYTLAGEGAGSTSTETNGFQLLQGSEITFKNGTINYKEGQSKIFRMFQSYADVTFENMIFETEHQAKAYSQPTAEHYAFSFCNGNVKFTGKTSIISKDKNAVSFIAGNYANYPATHVIFDENFSGSVNSIMEYSGPNTENYSMIIRGKGTFGGLKTTKGDDPNGFKIYSGTFMTPDCLEYLGENADVKIQLDRNIDYGITIPKNTAVNLDLNGKTIVGNNQKAAIRNEGTLTIEDNSGEKTGVVKRNDNADSLGYYVVDNQGTMTIKGGKFENNTGKLEDEATQKWTGSSLVRNGGEKEAVLNIVDGVFMQDNFIVIKNDDYGKLHMTGGHIVTKNPVASAIQNWSIATVSGGKIDGMIWTATWSDDLPDSVTTLEGTVEVTGEIRAGYAGGQAYANNKNSNVVINGGIYNSTFVTQTPTGQDVGKGTKIEVIKGTFINKEVLPYMKDGNVALFTNGKYEVLTEEEAKKEAVGYITISGEKVYLIDKADIDDIVTDSEKPEIKDTTDYGELKNLIKEYKKLDKAMYTADSFARFEEVLRNAETVLENKNSTQEEVDTLVEELKAAKEQLEKNSSETGNQQGTIEPSDKGNGGTSLTNKGAVKTGDTANVAGYMTVMVLAAGMVVAALRKKRRA